jgi:hypothetical protein
MDVRMSHIEFLAIRDFDLPDGYKGSLRVIYEKHPSEAMLR